MDLILVDDKQMMAGTFLRYFRHRFGNLLNVVIASDAQSCIKKAADGSHVIVLDYPNNGTHDETGRAIADTIKTERPGADVFLITEEASLSKDIVRATKRMEKLASEHLINNKGVSTSIGHRLLFPFRVYMDEFSVNDFLYMYLAIFILMGLMVWAAILSVKMF